MTIKFFDEEVSSTSGSIPFLDEWIKNNSKNKKKDFYISEIVRVKSNKGYLVKTSDFSVFIWMNSKLAKQLVEALDLYVNKIGYGYNLVVHLNNPTKAEFKLGCDTSEQITWFSSKNGYSLTESFASSVVDTTENPFIPKEMLISPISPL